MEALLLESCGTCHGPAYDFCGGGCTGWNFVNNMQRMVEEGKIIPCDWGESPVGMYVSIGHPFGRGGAGLAPMGVAPMSDADQARLESFVNGMCSNLTDGGPSDVERIASETLLRRSCGACHGARSADGGPPAGGIGNIDDIGSLIQSMLITPCVGSPLLNAMGEGSMPPADSDAPRPSRAEIRRFANFIDRPCAR